MDAPDADRPPSDAERSGHESLDVQARRAKARKIKRLLGSRLEGVAVLDVGVGAGTITSDLARSVGPAGSVTGVDVRDSRVESDGYSFHIVDGVQLPFEDASFDVVVSNHVIEHVGSDLDQAKHLWEISRVLKRGGTLYLATPNRWTLIEPHFKLPFLSWIPARAADGYVRATRRGHRYDCELLTRTGLRRLIQDAGFDATDKTVDAIGLTAEIEGGWLARVLGRLPLGAQRVLAPLTPTIILLAERR